MLKKIPYLSTIRLFSADIAKSTIKDFEQEMPVWQ
jgi:hypothetical protein